MHATTIRQDENDDHGRFVERDSGHAQAFVNSTSNYLLAAGQIPVVFHDLTSLRDGHPFDVDMVTALSKSLVVTPFVTAAALARMWDPRKLNKVDNVLMEWWLALSLYKKGKVKAIVPVFCGKVRCCNEP